MRCLALVGDWQSDMCSTQLFRHRASSPCAGKLAGDCWEMRCHVILRQQRDCVTLGRDAGCASRGRTMPYHRFYRSVPSSSNVSGDLVRLRCRVRGGHCFGHLDEKPCNRGRIARSIHVLPFESPCCRENKERSILVQIVGPALHDGISADGPISGCQRHPDDLKLPPPLPLARLLHLPSAHFATTTSHLSLRLPTMPWMIL